MKIDKLIKKVLLFLLLICILAGFTVMYKGYVMYANALKQMSLSERVEAVKNQEGYTRFEELPQVYVNAVISVEDHRFYQHGGIDLIAIARAVYHDIKAGEFIEGGSTITQQLAKNLCFNQNREITRKAAEVFMAYKLEENYSKDEIFELYVNCIYFGDGYYSVGEASQGYFNKSPDKMTEYESTLLAGIPNAPSVYSPTKNPELARKRQQKVLERMEECGYLSKEEVETMVQQTVAFQ